MRHAPGRLILALFLPLTALAAPRVAAQSSTEWATSFERAVEFARERNTLVMISIRAPGERGSDALEEIHDRDRRLLDLTAKTVNVLVVAAPKARRSPVEETVRRQILEIEGDGDLAVPHHVLIDPTADNRIVSSARGELTPGQLEWLIADALRRHDPQFEFAPADRTRAPTTVRFGEADAATGTLPPDEDAVEAAIDALKKSRFNRDSMQHYQTILQSDAPAALKFGKTELRQGRGFMARMAIETIGRISPPAWADFPIEALEDRDEGMRESAARALESLATEDARRDLQKLLRREDDVTVRGRMLRALAASAPADRTTIGLVGKALRDRDAAVRLQATMALERLEDDDAVQDGIERALGDAVADVRAAAAYVIASRREPELRALLDAALEAETDAEVREWLQLAVDTIDGPQSLGRFLKFAQDKAGDRGDAPSGRGRRGERGGEGEGEGDGKGEAEPGAEEPAGGGRRGGGGGRRGGTNS